MNEHRDPSSEVSFDSILLPLASEEDAARTCTAIRQYLSSTTEVTVVHVIEKAGGGIDPASVEQRERRAQRTFARCESDLRADVGTVTTTVTYHTDIVTGILETAKEEGADAIAFTPRGANRILKLISGDTAFELIHRTDHPVFIVPPADRGQC